MNFILNNSNNKIGGIEVLFLEIARFLSHKQHNIYFVISSDDDIYMKNLIGISNVYFLKKQITKPIEFITDSELELERKNIFSQLDCNGVYYVISPFYGDLQYAIAMFSSYKRFYLSHLWPHPQDWCSTIKFLNKGFVTTKHKSSKYFYQKKLIEFLHRKKADFYSARAVVVFNKWYYELDFEVDRKIEALPISDLFNDKLVYNPINRFDILKVVWCGRFEYFKNEAIIQIHNTLELLAKQYPKMTIQYDIIGYGYKKQTKDVKDNIKPEKVKVNYLGIIDPDKLSDVFKEYDIGIGMGLTVKKMGQVGLPSIIIDSTERGSMPENNANWLYETTEEGDAGDGYYYKISGGKINVRKPLFEILQNVIDNPSLLKKHSEKSKQYVEDNYSMKKQVDFLIHRVTNSEFVGCDFPFFRRSIFLRYAYYVAYKLNKIAKNFI
jgi:hypothetical protein